MAAERTEATRARDHAYYLAHQDKIKARSHQYRVAHPDKLRAYRQAHYQTNKQILTKQQRAYYLANKDRITIRQRTYNASHQEARRLQAHTYYLTNKAKLDRMNKLYQSIHYEELLIKGRAFRTLHAERLRAALRARRRANPEPHRNQQHQRRARKMAVLGSATPEQLKAIKAAYNGRCAYCGVKPTKLTIDHVVPLSKNGTHTPENLVPACPFCNYSKRDREPKSMPAVRLLL